MSSGDNSYTDLEGGAPRFSIMHIIGICSSMLAYQIAYSVEFALGTPIMSHIGVSTTASTFIWLSGPLSGLIVQPLIGFYSDLHTSKFGRRRPFIVFGGIGIISGFVLLYFVESLGKLFNSSNPKPWEITFVTFALLITNVSINVLQGPARALVGDLVPQGQQVSANTVGSVMIGIASVISNLIGGLQLSKLFNNKITNNQIVIIAGLILIFIGIITTLIVAKEKPLKEAPKRENPFTEIIRAFKNIPSPVLKISIVYFFSWMAYYPFNLSTTDFFGQDIFHGDAKNDDQNYEDGTAFGMLVIAVSNVLVLFYSPFQSKMIELVGLRWAYAISQILEAVCLVFVFFVKNKWALMGLFAPLGISCTIFNSVPFAVVGQCVSQDQMGIYMGVLNAFAVVGQQISNWLLGAGVGSLVSTKAPIIASGSVFAVVAAFMCKYIELAGDQTGTTPLIQSDMK